MKEQWEHWVQRMLLMSQDRAGAGRCPYGLEASDQGFDCYLRVLFEKEAEFRVESNAAVCHFIRTGEWPKQSPWADYITFLRVNCAADFACQLTAHDHSQLTLPFPKGTPDAMVLEWFLIDHWERFFDVWLKLTALSVFFSLPFYGLKPAQDMGENEETPMDGLDSATDLFMKQWGDKTLEDFRQEALREQKGIVFESMRAKDGPRLILLVCVTDPGKLPIFERGLNLPKTRSPVDWAVTTIGAVFHKMGPAAGLRYEDLRDEAGTLRALTLFGSDPHAVNTLEKLFQFPI